MSIFKKKPQPTPDDKLKESISHFFEKDLWDLCRGNYDFLVNAVKDECSQSIAAALHKIGKYSPENLTAMIKIQTEYQETKVQAEAAKLKKNKI
jgi:hypothetical protein